MANEIIFGSSVGIWDFKGSERVRIRIRICRDPFLILIHVASRAETYTMVLIEVVFETFEERKLFIWTPTPRYFKSTIGSEVFWPLKDFSLG
jgi:hypothetical protein